MEEVLVLSIQVSCRTMSIGDLDLPVEDFFLRLQIHTSTTTMIARSNRTASTMGSTTDRSISGTILSSLLFLVTSPENEQMSHASIKHYNS